MASKRKQPTFETERLRLRPFRKGDLRVLHTLYSDADNLRYYVRPPSPNLEHTRTMLAWHLGYRPDNYVLWAVELHKTRRLIGMINYHNRDLRGQRADLTWLLRPQYQGHGYMVEAGRALLRHLFDDMKVHKVEALIRKENKPSIALAKRLGFRLEGGPIRDRWFKDGRWHSVMLYGLVEGEER